MDWLSLPDFVELSNLLLAQNPSPSPGPSSSPSPADIELLKSQLEFLNKSHNQFAESVKQFVDTMKAIFVVLGIVLGIAGSIVAYFFGKSFKDFQELAQKDIKAFREFAKEDFKVFRELAEREVRGATEGFKEFRDDARKDMRDFQEFSRRDVQDAIQRIRQEAEAQIPRLVETEVGDLIRAEVANVERTLRREQVISSTIVDYYLPGAGQPDEFYLLQARKFRNVKLFHELEEVRRDPGDVVVLDLQNWTVASGQRFIDLSEEEREGQAKDQIDGLLQILAPSAVVVVYVRLTVKYLFRVTNRYILPANNPVTLVGNTADGAYVAMGDRSAKNV